MSRLCVDRDVWSVRRQWFSFFYAKRKSFWISLTGGFWMEKDGLQIRLDHGYSLRSKRNCSKWRRPMWHLLFGRWAGALDCCASQLCCCVMFPMSWVPSGQFALSLPLFWWIGTSVQCFLCEDCSRLGHFFRQRTRKDSAAVRRMCSWSIFWSYIYVAWRATWILRTKLPFKLLFFVLTKNRTPTNKKAKFSLFVVLTYLEVFCSYLDEILGICLSEVFCTFQGLSW